METHFGKRNWDLPSSIRQCGYMKPELPLSSSCERVLILAPRAHYHIRVESQPESIIVTESRSQSESLVLKPQLRSAEFKEGRLGQTSTTLYSLISASECFIGVISYFDWKYRNTLKCVFINCPRVSFQFLCAQLFFSAITNSSWFIFHGSLIDAYLQPLYCSKEPS